MMGVACARVRACVHGGGGGGGGVVGIKWTIWSTTFLQS